MERNNAITFRGSAMTLVGPELHPGDPAPDFTLTTTGMAPITLREAIDGEKGALFIVVPSVDTPTCARETMTFHQRRSELPDGVRAYVVSADLPFAQARWAAANSVEGIDFLSDYRDHSFGEAYGLTIKELAILARAVILVDKDGVVRYGELVKEVSEEPNYDAVFTAAKAL
jgi:thiol peroxidase